MAILIDGYNFLHASGIFSPAVGPGSLIKLHQAVLDFLIRHLTATNVTQTTIVFDAKGRRATKRRTLEHSGIIVHYSSRFEEADNLLAELIEADRNPRQLLVVSSDHQVQRSARRRGATPIDSETWYAQLIAERRKRERAADTVPDSKPFAPLSHAEAAWWLQQFSPDLLEELQREESASRSIPAETKAIANAPSEGFTAPQADDPTQQRGATMSPDERRVDPPAKRPRPLADDESPFPQSYLEAIERELLSNGGRMDPPPSPAKPRTKR